MEVIFKWKCLLYKICFSFNVGEKLFIVCRFVESVLMEGLRFLIVFSLFWKKLGEKRRNKDCVL